MAYWISLPPISIAIVTILTLALSFIFKHKNISQYFICFALISCGAFIYQSSLPPSDFIPFNTRIIGRICEPVRVHSKTVSFPIDKVFLVKGEEYTAINKKVWVRVSTNKNSLELGSSIDLTGKLSLFKPRRNPGDFDLKRWRERNGYIGEFFVDRHSNPIIHESNTSVLIGIRKIIHQSINTNIPSEEALMNALILGIRRDINPVFLDALKNTGLLHLIALSGLHVGFLAAVFFGLAAVFRLSLTGRVLFAIAGIMLFLLLVPPRASTLRAAIMIMLLISGPILKRWSPALNTIGFAGVLILSFRPGDLFDVGFQFSFAAICGLVLFSEPINRIGRNFAEKRGKMARLVKRFILVPLLISASASIMIMPFTAYHFDYITPTTPIFNILALPLMSLVYIGGWLMIFFSVFSNTLASIVSESLQLLIFLWKQMTIFMSNVSATLNISIAPVSIFIIISTILWSSFSNRKILFKSIVILLIIGSAIMWNKNLQLNPAIQVWFLDVGQGDAVIVKLHDDGIFVIDAGPEPYNTSFNPVVNTLHKFDCHNIDLLVASHPDADHIGGMGQLIKEFRIDNAITTVVGSETEIFRDLKQISALRHLNWQSVACGDELKTSYAECQIRVLSPPRGINDWSTNDASVVLLISFHIDSISSSNLLLTGDIGEKAEKTLIKTQQISAGLLKTSHHGSNKSSSLEFLKAVNPEYAVVSRSGRFESGIRKTIIRLKKQNISTVETVSSGAILFEPIENGNWKQIDWHNQSFLTAHTQLSLLLEP